MSTIRRGIAASALALPIALGTAGIASADTGYNENHSTAGPDGAGTASVSATTSENGSSFEQSSTWAGPNRASSESTEASAGANGATSFESGSNSAGANGASSDSVSSYTDGVDADHDQANDVALSGLLSGIL